MKKIYSTFSIHIFLEFLELPLSWMYYDFGCTQYIFGIFYLLEGITRNIRIGKLTKHR